MINKAYLFGKDKEISCVANVMDKPLENNIHAVLVNASAPFALDPMDGVYCEFSHVEDIEACMGVVRRGEYWCRPFFCSDFGGVPDEAQLLLVKHRDHTYTIILPVVLNEYRSVLKSENGKLYLRLFSQCDNLQECQCLAAVYTRTENPYAAIKELFAAAIKEANAPIKLREEREYPDIFEYLGWCSWDSMQIRVCEDGLSEKCNEFKEKNIPVRWGIIDDMWAYIPKFKNASYSNFNEMVDLMHASELGELEADSVRFPNGLSGAIEKMKEVLTWVGMWYPSTGYWAGLTPGSKIYTTLNEHLALSTSNRWLAKPEYEHFKAFFDAFNSYLKESGADFVKIDNQSNGRQHYKNTRPVGLIAKEMHKAIEESTDAYFDNKLINCMGCMSENVWNRPHSPISRCSGDFMPEDAEWFTQHILQCSFMSFLQSSLIWCDWDMWWTDDGQAKKNSLLRALSGGPIYVSDKIGRSKKELLTPLCFNDGKILRCDRPALPARDSLVGNPEDNGKMFKIQNICKGAGLVAVFNLDKGNRPVDGFISPDDVEGIEGEEFAVYEYFSHKFYTLSKSEKVEIQLDNKDDFRLYVFVPIINGFAAIGRTDKYISSYAVKGVDGDKIELIEDGPYAYYKDGEFFEISSEK